MLTKIITPPLDLKYAISKLSKATEKGERQRRGMGQRTEGAMEEKLTRAPSKRKASFHRPRCPSLLLCQHTSRRIARPKPVLTMKVVDRDKSSATGDRTIGRQLLMMQGQNTESCNNLLEMAMVKLPPVDIIRIGMDPNPPRAEILDTCMYSDPKDQKQTLAEKVHRIPRKSLTLA